METSETQSVTNPTEEQEIIERVENVSDAPVDTEDDKVVDDKESESESESESEGEDEDEGEGEDEDGKSGSNNKIFTCENLRRASEELAIEDAMPVNRHSNNFYSSIQIGAICVICAYIGFITGIYVAHDRY